MDLAPLLAILEALNSEVESAEVERANQHDALKLADARLARLRREREGIQSYIHRHQDTALFPPITPEDADNYLSPDLPRSEAVAQVLANGSGPMTPAEIRDALHKAGRDDEYRDVAAALSHLKSRGRANNVARGVWELLTESPEVGPPGGADGIANPEVEA